MTRFRFSQEQDRPRLKEVWKISFGDSDELIDRFLDHFGVNAGIVGECGGDIVSAAYILPTDGLVMKDNSRRSCSYLYAISVLPDYRGNGLGKEITLAAVEYSSRLGYEYTVLKPSDEGLFDFYASLGFTEFSYANELSFSPSGQISTENNLKLLPISPEEYGRIRKRNLDGRTHIALSDKAAAYQGKLGALYCLYHEGNEFCAAVEKSNDTLFIKELLVPGDLVVPAVSALSREIPATNCRVTVPVFDEKTAVKTGMIFPAEDFTSDLPFLCLAYD
ncbi:MAG: GNAT family N-acetyltransferase [Clostridiales bacterium]|nr:GNAT family N-acetyltransferase [Clostridiales bacterium]